MIESTTSGQGGGSAQGGSAHAATFGVRTSALHSLCTDLQRAVEQGRQLLEHPCVVRGRAEDAGDDDLRAAVTLFASRWQWGLRVLVDDASALLTDLRSAAELYDEVERSAAASVQQRLGLAR
jgi:hypothetical protein